MHLTAIDDAAWASPWRRRSIGEKVGLCVALVVTALTAPVWPAAPLVLLVTTGLALGWARIGLTTYLLALSLPLAFILIGVVTIGVTVGGAPAPTDLFRLGPFAASADSLHHAGLILGRSLSGTSAMLLLALTTPMVDLLTWGRKLKVPDALLEVASLIYRLVFVLLSSVFEVREAQLNRLVDCGPRANRWRASANAIGSIMIRAWQRAQRLNDGLAARGYESALVTLPIARTRDPLFIVVALVLLATIWTTSLLTQTLFR